MSRAFEDCIYQTERICLRGLKKEDLQGGYPSWFDDQEVCEFNSHGIYPAAYAEMERFVDSLAFDRSRIVWAIVDKASRKHIGNISLQNIDAISRSAELAIIIGEKDFWGRGYGHEASRILIRHGFYKLNLHYIHCGTAATNQGMRRLAESLGMSQEGIRRQALFLNGEYVDLHEFGLLRDEFQA